MEVETNDKTTTENTTKKRACTGEALEIPVVEKAQTSTRKPRPVVQFDFDDQLGHKLPTGYRVPWTEVDEIIRPLVDDFGLLLCSSNSITDAKYDRAASFLRGFFVPPNH